MKHFLYKTTSSTSGKYYIGRHSTKNLDDGYLGSGRWIRQIKDKSILNREILQFFDTFEELLEAEKCLIAEHIDDPLNMNWNNSSVGFGTGDFNPARSEKERLRRSENSWMKTDDGRKWASENNASRMPHVKILRKEKALEQIESGIHNFQRDDVIKKRIKNLKVRMVEDNPMFRMECREMASVRAAEQVQNGSHNFQDPEVRQKSLDSVNNLFKQRRHPFQDPEFIRENAEKTSLRMSADNPAKRPEVRAKISAAKKGKKLNISELARKQRSEALKLDNPARRPGVGAKISAAFKNRPIRICPHCNKEGRSGAMTRFHFDNCKQKSKL